MLDLSSLSSTERVQPKNTQLDMLLSKRPVSKLVVVVQLFFSLGLAGHSQDFRTNEQHPIGSEGVHDLR